MDMLHMDVLRCDGRTAESVRRPGDVKGHILPGLALCLWSVHVFMSAAWRYSVSDRDPSAPPFVARTWEPVLPFLPFKRWRRFNRAVPLDSIFKVLGGLAVMVVMYNNIVCPDGVRIGRIVGQHINRWAHATLGLCFCTVGLVELLALVARLPRQTSSAALVVAHLVVTDIFLFHQKHELLDQVTHGILGYSFLGAAICGVMEIFVPSSFLPLAAKLYFHTLSGAWLGAIGFIIYANITFWSPTFNGALDVTPSIFAPVFFTLLMLGVFAFLLLLYVAMDVLVAWELRRRQAGAAAGAGAGAEVDRVDGIALLPVLSATRKGSGAEESQGLLAREDPGRAAEQQAYLGGAAGGMEAFGTERRKGVLGHGPMY